MFNTDQFNYKDRVFTAEASDFGEPNFSVSALFSRVFPDACDEGFVLRSARTNHVVVVTHHKTHRDAEGDITHWEFVPYRNSSFDRVIVFND